VRNTAGGGTGLGIARNITRAHAEDLTLSSHPEGGLCARQTLPKQDGFRLANEFIKQACHHGLADLLRNPQTLRLLAKAVDGRTLS
jgi:hypothetical protein